MPPSVSKKLAASFSITADYAFAAFSVIQDCLRALPSVKDAVVFLEGELPPADLAALSRDMQIHIKPYDLPDIIFESYTQPSKGRFPKILFSRFENIALLSDYDQVIAFDVDQVLTKSLSDLLEIEAPIVCVRGGDTMKPNFHAIPIGYDASQPAANANIMIFNREPLKLVADLHELTDWCYSALLRHGSQLYLPEQAVFNLASQRFSFPLHYLSGDYSLHPNADPKLVAEAPVLHAYAQPKFWNGLENSQFNENYQRWLSYGGSPHRWDSARAPKDQPQLSADKPQTLAPQETAAAPIQASILGGSSDLFNNNIQSIIQKLRPELTIELGCGMGKLGLLHNQAIQSISDRDPTAKYLLVGVQPGTTEQDAQLLASRGYNQIIPVSIEDYCSAFVDANCNLFVAIDVLEHLPRHMIFSVIDQLLYHCQYFLVIWPSRHPQNANGNSYDAHRSSFSLLDIVHQFSVITYLETGFAQIASMHRYHLVLLRGHMNIANNLILF